MTLSYLLTHARTSQDLPYLTLKAGDSSADAPVVLVLHGLGRSKEHMLPTLYAFAQAGFQAVAMDARLHGDRDRAAQRDALLEAQYVPTLYEMIAGSAQDISGLLDDLGAAQAAVHGVSLGGYIAFTALLHEPRLAAATIAMGSPDWLEPMRALGIGPGNIGYDMAAAGNPLDLAPSLYPPRPLLMLHGDQDEVVSVAGVRGLHNRLLPLYGEVPERLRLIVYPGLGHRYTDDMVHESVAWTRRFL